MNDEARQKISRACAWMVINARFYANVLLAMSLVERTDLPFKSMAVDGLNIYYDPDFVLRHPDEELRAVLLHEVLHVVLMHITRRQENYETIRWAKAIDYATNLIIKDEEARFQHSLRLPDSGLLDYQYKGMTAEQIYRLLPEEKGSPMQMPGDGDEGESGGEDQSNPGQPPSKGGGSGQPKSGGGFDEHITMEAEAEAKALRIITSAYESLTPEQRSRGTIPGAVEEAIKELLRPKRNWRRFIRATASDIFKQDDESWDRPNRLFIHQGIYLPGLTGEKNTTLAVIVDTSGSVRSEELKAFMGEIQGICELAETTYVLPVDAECHGVFSLDEMDNVIGKIKMIGRGGTSFEPGFKELQKRKIRPEMCIYLTDGECYFPQQNPGYPVIWAITPGRQLPNPPWGECIMLEGLLDKEK